MSDITENERTYNGLEIAVIGISGRFPAANNLAVFWRNLVDGVDAVSRFTDEELVGVGVDGRILDSENYVRAKGVFPDIEYFDAAFFNYTPADATLLDPQVRALHQEVYHALEDAGYSAEWRREAIGLFLGATNNVAWETHTLSKYVQQSGLIFTGTQLNDKDYAASRIAYSLGLKGAAFTLHTACSTSLVAIDMACRNIWTGACQVALAGGSSLTLPHKNGYVYQENMINSPDGECRAFDKDASGTVEGNGVGVVALKRLETALRDGDHVYAVIKGSAVNNDGNRKVGYTAPSIEGQAEVIRKAHRVAKVDPSEVSYVETHGTGTALGDPVEVEALRKAFGSGEPRSTAISSLKSNIGHLDTAAGVASFIKACKVLEQRTIPQNPKFTEPNPNLRFEDGPFYVAPDQEELRRKRSATDETIPLRAGVSSFGIGGTNAHLVLEEAPTRARATTDNRAHHTFVVSAASADAITHIKRNFVEYLTTDHDVDSTDLAWTLQNRQRDLPYRYAVAYSDADHLREQLEGSLEAGDEAVQVPKSAGRDVYFLFSGLGAQHLQMARGLYATEETFRAEFDACLAISDAMGNDVPRQVFFADTEAAEKQLNIIETTQVMLFMVEYSIAKMLVGWGLKPKGMIGHSTGEIAAACVAGVFSLEDGIHLIHARGNLMDQTPEGTLTSVKASEEVVRPLLAEGLSLAAVNSPEDCSVSGPAVAVEAFEQRCAEQEVRVTRVAADHAYHSPDMDVILEQFRAVAAKVNFNAPAIPYVSNVTGTWITPEQAQDPDYYCSHVRETVQFEAGTRTLMERGDAIFVEVGPGKSLSSFVRGIAGQETGVVAINMLRHRLQEIGDDEHLAHAIGKLWEAGVALDWTAFHRGGNPRKLQVPLYPFDKIEYPIDIEDFQRFTAGFSGGETSALGAFPRPHPVRTVDVADLTQPLRLEWSRSAPPFSAANELRKVLMTFTDDVNELTKIMAEIPHWRVLYITFGDRYEFRPPSGAVVRSNNEDDLKRLVNDLESHALVGDTFLVHRRDHVSSMTTARTLCSLIPGMQESCVTDVMVLDTSDDLRRRAEFVAQVIGLNYEYPRVRIKALGCDAERGDKEVNPAWHTVLQRELQSEANDDVAVRYVNGRRLVPMMVPVHSHGERPFAGRTRSTAIACQVEDIEDVLADLGDADPLSTFQVVPFTCQADAPQDRTDTVNGRTTVLSPVTGSTWAAVVTGLSDRMRDLPPIDEIVVWDAPDHRRVVNDSNTERADKVARRTILEAMRSEAKARQASCYVLSRSGLDQTDWDSGMTSWFAENELIDTQVDLVRLYSFGRVPFGQILDLFPQMAAMGVRTAYHGSDPLRAVSGIKHPRSDNASGQKRNAISAVIQHEFTNLLGFSEINGRADLFELGLDSVKLVQFTNAMGKHGYKVVAGDVYNNPTVSGLAGLIDRTTHQNGVEGNSHESLTSLLEERLQTPCSFQEFQPDSDGECFILLFVDGLDNTLKKQVIQEINNIQPPAELVPHHILPRTLEDNFLANEEFASLGIGIDTARQDQSVEAISAEVERLQEEMRQSISRQPVKWRYPINGTQKLHFSGEVRLQLYLMEFAELVDVEILERALCDVIGRHGLLRSFLCRSFGQFRWKEFEPPTTIALPQVDMSSWDLHRQQQMRAELVKREWSMDFKTVDKLMYHPVLLKYNEKSYDLLIQFDHSIFDVTSGQTFRADLTERYHQLMAGTTRAMPAARNFRHLKEQLDKGPVNITPGQIVEKFDLDRHSHYSEVMRRRAASLVRPKIKHVRYSVELSRLQSPGEGDLDSFSTAAHLYARLVSRLIDVDHVALDLLFRSRVFESTDYSDVMGMILGSLPMVISGERGSKGEVRADIDEKTRLVNENNISFFNLVQGLRSRIKYRSVNYRKVGGSDDLRTMCLFNFVGEVDDEYSAVWDMTMEQLTGDQDDKLDYADCYGIAKMSNGRLDLVILTKWVEDPDVITKILDDEVKYLMESPGAAAV